MLERGRKQEYDEDDGEECERKTINSDSQTIRSFAYFNGPN